MWKTLCSLALLPVLLTGCGKDSDPSKPTTCPSGTVKWTNGHCYQAVLAPGVSWDDAQAACVARGGHLATIASEEENEFVFSLVSGDSAFWYVDAYNNGLGPWLGGYQPDGSAEPGGDWRWVTDEPFVYTNWETGQPDEGGGGSQNRLRFFKLDGVIGNGWDDAESDNPPAHRSGYVFEHD
jgi:hypothetical protein